MCNFSRCRGPMSKEERAKQVLDSIEYLMALANREGPIITSITIDREWFEQLPGGERIDEVGQITKYGKVIIKRSA